MKELYQALLAAKLEFKPIQKNKKNPFHKSNYADLDHILECIEPSLHKYGLIITQPVVVLKDGSYTETRQHSVNEKGIVTDYHHKAPTKVLKTIITHVTTGQQLTSDGYELPSGVDSQKFGAAITYARRYDLCSLLGITADTDDDGNTASGKQSAPPTDNPSYKPSYSYKR